jgi:hypothetical protein
MILRKNGKKRIPLVQKQKTDPKNKKIAHLPFGFVRDS